MTVAVVLNFRFLVTISQLGFPLLVYDVLKKLLLLLAEMLPVGVLRKRRRVDVLGSTRLYGSCLHRSVARSVPWVGILRMLRLLHVLWMHVAHLRLHSWDYLSWP